MAIPIRKRSSGWPRHGIAIWRTDRDGTVDVETDGRSMIVRGKGRTERYDVTGATH